ncbi:alpha/beta fold hydrolase [Cupriavidus numazuensis]|uniref:Aminoacrylate hydrolase RutD n=1 Tax=Cupriavidus numazuensis TaxID=221992 RepID=A0ABM8TLM5_9BURK|nr:alpha/beta fold hydrolase [Cupriavidus numazuensis]CAG2153268.1 Putative aminoacrylate hydrolase RutD [Cupriavidus numazuensis]
MSTDIAVPAVMGANCPAAEKMDWLEVNGVSLRYSRHAGAGPLLVLIHEMGGTLESWDAVCKSLGESVNWLRYDTRGAGGSEKLNGSVALDDHVDDLHALLEALDERRPLILVGVAVGAAIALRFAARNADRVVRVVGLAPACGVIPAKQASTLALAARLREYGMRTAYPALFELGWPSNFAGEGAQNLLQRTRYLRRSLANDASSFAYVLEMLAGTDLAGDLAELSTEVTLIAGYHDALRPPGDIAKLAALGRSIAFGTVASGHFMPVQSPGLVSTLLRHRALGGAPLAQVLAALG